MHNSKIKLIVAALALSGFFLALSASTAFARRSRNGICQLLPADWMPSLTQVADTLDELGKAQTQESQQDLNLLSQNKADVRDAELFITFVQMAQSLNAREQRKLCAEQQRWLDKRATSADAAVSSKGGSLATAEYNDTFRKITEERLAELQKRLNPPNFSTKLKK